MEKDSETYRGILSFKQSRGRRVVGWEFWQLVAWVDHLKFGKDFDQVVHLELEDGSTRRSLTLPGPGNNGVVPDLFRCADLETQVLGGSERVSSCHERAKA